MIPSLSRSVGLFRKGSGEWIDFSRQPLRLAWSLGSGRKRKIGCGPECDLRTIAHHAKAEFSKINNVVATQDGNIYVGDFNLIRKVDLALGTVETVFKFR